MSTASVFVIGDSISVHYGPSLERFLPAHIAYDRKQGEEAFEDLDVPKGANGGDSGMVLRYLRHRAENGGLDAELLLVNCGLHDIKTHPETGEKQVPLAEYQQNLEAIIALGRQTLGVAFAWIRTTPVDDQTHNSAGPKFHRHVTDLAAYNAAADVIMQARDVPVLDLCGFTEALGGVELFCDHVHFTEEVREKQGAHIAGWVAGYFSTAR